MVQITIEFPDEKHKDAFLGQVSDGAMEDMCDIRAINPEPPDENGAWHRPFGGATKFVVEIFDEWLR